MRHPDEHLLMLVAGVRSCIRFYDGFLWIQQRLPVVFVDVVLVF